MLVEIIAPTYDRTLPLITLIASLENQTDKDWGLNIVVDGDCGVAEAISKLFGSERVKITYTGQRYNDWGHTPREIGKQASEAEYVLMSGDDNYYVPSLVAEIRKAAEDKPGMIYWDMVHSHYNYDFFRCSPGFNAIDMGAFATRSDLAKQIKLKTSYAADGEFIEEFKQRFPNERIVKINHVLFVHN